MSRKKFKVKATIFDKRGKVISCGTNSYEKTHPLQYKLSKQCGNPDAIYLHAEIAAIVKLKKYHSAHKILIERYDSEGKPRMAKPCQVCALAIKQADITVVEYTEN
jgi:tRNA(Arg) A34 adenosine deaminase TadA